MKQCRKCGVYVDEDSANCPLCGAFVHEETAPTVYEYPQVDITKKRKLLFKISGFATVFTIALVIIINLAVSKNVTWALHVVFGFALAWICAIRPIMKNFCVRKFLTWGFVGVIALLFYINIWTSRLATPWALTLGMPIAVLTWQSVLEVLAIARKGVYADYQVSLTKIFVLSAIFIGVSFIWTKTCGWGWYVCTARGFLDILVLAFFAKDNYVNELKKRLHI